MSIAAAESLISRIEKLLSLAESPNENEARNAALQACRLINKHKVPIRPLLTHIYTLTTDDNGDSKIEVQDMSLRSEIGGVSFGSFHVRKAAKKKRSQSPYPKHRKI